MSKSKGLIREADVVLIAVLIVVADEALNVALKEAAETVPHSIRTVATITRKSLEALAQAKL